ncbi:GNAT family N-acetyltransferase [Streptomyces gobitricini]|uniref:Uncharacterized protein n=1 Tax=Streptomyces gobitricini TaxID=68211 RepID=A0ABP5YST5_9ACTN
MFFRWDWLRPRLTAPIVPTLGPVHPDALTAGIFEDVLRAVSPEMSSPYDKDRRWGGEKDEKVLRENVLHQPERVLVPTLNRRGRGTVRVFAYGPRDSVVDEAAELAAELAAAYAVVNARVVRPLGPETTHPRGTRVQLKDFTAGHCPAPAGPVRPITDLPTAVRETFAPFAEAMPADGLAFLRTRMRADRCGPVLTAAVAGRLVGAIGPCAGASPTAPPTNSSRPRSAAPPTGCARPKGADLSRLQPHRGCPQVGHPPRSTPGNGRYGVRQGERGRRALESGPAVRRASSLTCCGGCGI